eukprot:TRINITY_DN16278_c0_g1_i1.p1 TRINITY_DN16278_c0_g1~~TRINITY_DN16278_c0_g1_i1.p1  ORF type:complete len:100 (-),score=4.81 TRINITY_DN16278_c0_g1_i1:119-418(-)
MSSLHTRSRPVDSQDHRKAFWYEARERGSSFPTKAAKRRTACRASEFADPATVLIHPARFEGIKSANLRKETETIEIVGVTQEQVDGCSLPSYSTFRTI